jgi:hypothetical protein
VPITDDASQCIELTSSFDSRLNSLSIPGRGSGFFFTVPRQKGIYLHCAQTQGGFSSLYPDRRGFIFTVPKHKGVSLHCTQTKVDFSSLYPDRRGILFTEPRLKGFSLHCTPEMGFSSLYPDRNGFLFTVPRQKGVSLRCTQTEALMLALLYTTWNQSNVR